MKWSKKLPNKPGYYWFYDCNLDEIRVLMVESYENGFYATDTEYGFDVKQGDKKDKWCYIPRPK